ncbi:MAG: hypothetical protein ACYCQJ_01985 [Nitrososphaerales archaeon]
MNFLQLYGSGSNWIGLLVFALFIAFFLIVIFYLARFLSKANKVMDKYLEQNKSNERH